MTMLLLFTHSAAAALVAPANPSIRHLPLPALPALSTRPVCMALTYPEYVKQKELKDARQKVAENGDAGRAFGASSSLVTDKELIKAAQEAAEKAGHAEKFSPSQIVIAFNSWKLSRGVNFATKEEAAAALRNFAADLRLITEHLEAAESALFSTTENINPFEDDELTEYLASEWRDTWKDASEARKAAEAQRAKALAGQVAAEDKLKQTVAVANKQEKEQIERAQAEYLASMRAAEEAAGQERARLAQLLAQVAENEKEARAAAMKRLNEMTQDGAISSANMIASAQADREGALHMFKQMEEQAVSAMQSAEMEMAKALEWAQEQEEGAKAAAQKKAQQIVAAQSEAKALLELLKQSKEEAAATAQRMENEKREMEKAVEIANKRVRKAKLAAAAALEDL